MKLTSNVEQEIDRLTANPLFGLCYRLWTYYIQLTSVATFRLQRFELISDCDVESEDLVAVLNGDSDHFVANAGVASCQYWQMVSKRYRRILLASSPAVGLGFTVTHNRGIDYY